MLRIAGTSSTTLLLLLSRLLLQVLQLLLEHELLWIQSSAHHPARRRSHCPSCSRSTGITSCSSRLNKPQLSHRASLPCLLPCCSSKAHTARPLLPLRLTMLLLLLLHQLCSLHILLRGDTSSILGRIHAAGG